MKAPLGFVGFLPNVCVEVHLHFSIVCLYSPSVTQRHNNHDHKNLSFELRNNNKPGLLSLSNLAICIKKAQFSGFKGLKVNLKVRYYPN